LASGSYLYAAEANFGLIIYDITDPAQPLVASDPSFPAVGWGFEVAKQGNTLFLVGNTIIGTDELHAIDVSNPYNPVYRDGYDTSGGGDGVIVQGQYAFVASRTAGLKVVNIANPSNLLGVGSLSPAGCNWWGIKPVNSNYAAVTDQYQGVYFINITNPAAPAIAGSLSSLSYLGDVYAFGQYAWVGSVGQGSLLLDISNPASPQVLSRRLGFRFIQEISVTGDYALVAGKENGCALLKLASPSSHEVLGSLPSYSSALSAWLNWPYAYVADYNAGLKIYSVEIPASPVAVGAYAGTGYASVVRGFGNYAAVINGSTLEILDISVPASPAAIGSYGLSSASSLELWGQYAVLGNSLGLKIFNLTNPTSPAEIASLSVGSISHALGTGHYLVAGGGAPDRLLLYDISAPALPQELDTLLLSAAVNKVALLDDYALVATADGVHCYRITPAGKLQESAPYGVSSSFPALAA
jgi:hypothetical protein